MLGVIVICGVLFCLGVPLYFGVVRTLLGRLKYNNGLCSDCLIPLFYLPDRADWFDEFDHHYKCPLCEKVINTGRYRGDTSLTCPDWAKRAGVSIEL